MNNGIKTTRFGFNCNQIDMEKSKKYRNFAEKKSVNSTVLFYIITVGLTMLFSAETVNAQFVMQPGTLIVEGNTRQRWDGPLTIHNFDPNNDITVELNILELTQKANGEWLPFTTDPCSQFDYYEGLDLSKVSSCSSWIKLEKKSVLVPRDSDASVMVWVTTPPKTKTGFYGATIMGSTKTRASQTSSVPIVLRSGVPVITKINTSSLGDKVKVLDVGMEFVPSEGTVPGKVLATMKVKNEGNTYPRLRAIVRIRAFMNNHWSVVTTHEFNDMGIIPGVELNLKSDIGKSLPSGKYRLDGILYVNGDMVRERKVGKDVKELQFEGDPLLTKAATDVPLDLDPAELTIKVRPGQDRSVPLKIHNASDELIRVEPILDAPKSFKGVALNNVKLEEAMTCMKWLEFSHKSLEIDYLKDKTLQITAKMPADALQYPKYYASLGLKAIYPDGQVAGTTWINVCVENPNVSANTEITGTSIIFTELNASRSEYIVQAKFDNVGNSHIAPTMARAAVVKAEGFGLVSALLSCDKRGMFLPYESRYYTGILDFSNLAADTYNLEALLDYPEGKTASKQIRIRVVNSGKAKKPEVIEQNVKSTDLVSVKW